MVNKEPKEGKCQSVFSDSATVIDAKPAKRKDNEKNGSKPHVNSVYKGSINKNKRFYITRAIAALLVLWGLDFLCTKTLTFYPFTFVFYWSNWEFSLATGAVLCVIANMFRTNRYVLTAARTLAVLLYFTSGRMFSLALEGLDINVMHISYTFPPLIMLSVYAWGMDNGLGSAKENFKKWKNNVKAANLNYRHGAIALVGELGLLYFSFYMFYEPEFFGSTFSIIYTDIISVVAGATIFRYVYRSKKKTMVHTARWIVLFGILGAGTQIVPPIVYDNPWLNMIWNMFPISASSIFMTLAVLSCLAFSIDLKRWKGRA